MVRIAVLADIHGNWVALKNVTDDLVRSDVHVIVGLGDYLNVSLGSAAVVEWMKQAPHAYFVRGDNDTWDSYDRFRHLAREDPYAQYQFVTRFPARIMLPIEGVTLLAQHGYPSAPIAQRGFCEDAVRETLGRSYVESVLDRRGADIVCLGDFHRPHVEIYDDLVLVHPGSVGAPRDQQPETAKYVLLDVDGPAVRIEQRSVPFSPEAAVNEMRAAFVEDPGPDVWLARWLGMIGGMESEWSPPFEPRTWHWRKGL